MLYKWRNPNGGGRMTEFFKNAERAEIFRDIISIIIDIKHMNALTPARLVEQIGEIQRMERGKLSVMRRGPDHTHFKLQAWENGKNYSRHVSEDQAPAVREAIDGYHKFQELTGRYAQQVIEKTRAELAAGSKKKKYRPRRKSSWPKSRKSSS